MAFGIEGSPLGKHRMQPVIRNGFQKSLDSEIPISGNSLSINRKQARLCFAASLCSIKIHKHLLNSIIPLLLHDARHSRSVSASKREVFTV